MQQYPVHTLAPDPYQKELKLVPPKPEPKVLCQFCGSVHASMREVLQCKAGNAG